MAAFDASSIQGWAPAPNDGSNFAQNPNVAGQIAPLLQSYIGQQTQPAHFGGEDEPASQSEWLNQIVNSAYGSAGYRLNANAGTYNGRDDTDIKSSWDSLGIPYHSLDTPWGQYIGATGDGTNPHGLDAGAGNPNMEMYTRLLMSLGYGNVGGPGIGDLFGSSGSGTSLWERAQSLFGGGNPAYDVGQNLVNNPAVFGSPETGLAGSPDQSVFNQLFNPDSTQLDATKVRTNLLDATKASGFGTNPNFTLPFGADSPNFTVPSFSDSNGVPTLEGGSGPSPAGPASSSPSFLQQVQQLFSGGGSPGSASGTGLLQGAMGIGSGLYGMYNQQKQRKLAEELAAKADPWGSSGGRADAARQLQLLNQNPSAAMASDPRFAAMVQASQRATAPTGQGSGAMAVAGAQAGGNWYSQRLAELGGLAGASGSGMPAAGFQLSANDSSNRMAGDALASIGYGVGRITGGGVNPDIAAKIFQQYGIRV